MLIGITGKKGSGKSTIAQYLCDTSGFEEYSIAKPLKDIARVIGFTESELYSNKNTPNPLLGICAREFMQLFGTEIVRDIFPKFFPQMGSEVLWVQLLRNHLTKTDNDVVVSDVRFPDEARVIQELGGVLVRVERNTVQDDYSSHSSETQPLPHDHILYNNSSLDELYAAVRRSLNLKE